MGFEGGEGSVVHNPMGISGMISKKIQIFTKRNTEPSMRKGLE